MASANLDCEIGSGNDQDQDGKLSIMATFTDEHGNKLARQRWIALLLMEFNPRSRALPVAKCIFVAVSVGLRSIKNEVKFANHLPTVCAI
jgi:hypothetical protein